MVLAQCHQTCVKLMAQVSKSPNSEDPNSSECKVVRMTEEAEARTYVFVSSNWSNVGFSVTLIRSDTEVQFEDLPYIAHQISGSLAPVYSFRGDLFDEPDTLRAPNWHEYKFDKAHYEV